MLTPLPRQDGTQARAWGGRDPFDHGLLGHSDADVLAHAVTDALLGAAGLEDIGHYFPDTDERFSDADSIELLREARLLLGSPGMSPTWTPWSSASGRRSGTTGTPCARTWREPWASTLAGGRARYHHRAVRLRRPRRGHRGPGRLPAGGERAGCGHASPRARPACCTSVAPARPSSTTSSPGTRAGPCAPHGGHRPGAQPEGL